MSIRKKKRKRQKHSRSLIKSWTLPAVVDTHELLQKEAGGQAQRAVTTTWKGVTQNIACNLAYEEEGSEVDPESEDSRITGSSSDCSQISSDSHTPVTSMGKATGKKEGDTNKEPAA